MAQMTAISATPPAASATMPVVLLSSSMKLGR
jgi:hypothetical protein